ncbi:hypothetical protein [Streptomyces sp. CHB9.2]|uniref:hypothetical protein n=1 Tax=Streptomyces sp. CHB9.2 TaxID=2841670 RepID=UPI0020960083|nr:hypothetical protein [Streptomyces sp. CHB9.2]MCO6704901.1 hypothetical protein [Streptomyces sp. CHB9.2]
MTTTVTINAHCSSEKQVQVSIVNRVTGEVHEEFVLQDGQSSHRVVFDDREIKIGEVVKPVEV